MKELNYKGFAAFDSLGLIAGRVPLVSRERYAVASRGSKGAIKRPFHVRGEGRLASQENSARARGCLSRAPGVVFPGLARCLFSPSGGYIVRVEGRLVSREIPERARGCLSRAPGAAFLGDRKSVV